MYYSQKEQKLIELALYVYAKSGRVTKCVML